MDDILQLIPEEELIHWGIKGQRWGVRRFENEDGTLTEAGKKRYAKYESKASEQYEKRESRDERFREKLANTTHKSKMRLRSEARYRAMGMSQEEAELAAYKRARAQKIGLAVGAVAITAAAAWVAKNHYDRVTDGFVKDGTVLKRVQIGEDIPVRDGLFFSYTPKDTERYAGMYGPMMLGKKDRDAPVFQVGMKVSGGGFKVASVETHRKAIADLCRTDPSFRGELLDAMESRPHWHISEEGTFRRAIRDLRAGKITTDVANAQNFYYNFHEPVHQKVHDKVFSSLREKGFAALYDVHDQKFSGFHTEAPIIFFGRGGRLEAIKAKKLNENWLKTSNIKHLVLSNLENIADWIPPAFAVGAAGAGVKTVISSRRNRKIIRDYLAEHPNSKLSNNEILRMEMESRGQVSHSDDDLDVLFHYGVKGQKWGVRNYEDANGHLTEAGKTHYYSGSAQRKDRKLYSKGAVKRIKKKVRNGQDLESARGEETDRLYRARDNAKVAGLLGAIGGAVLGSFTPEILQRGAEVSKVLVKDPSWISTHEYWLYKDRVKTASRVVGVIAGAKAGYTMSKNTAMRVQGYKAKRYKD